VIHLNVSSLSKASRQNNSTLLCEFAAMAYFSKRFNTHKSFDDVDFFDLMSLKFFILVGDGLR
jgi:hypothetical protein